MSLANLTSGLIGSVLGALFTFLAAAFALWRTRRADQEREDVRLREREEERREVIIAQMLASLGGLEQEVRWAPFLSGRASRRLLEATMNFYATQHRHHPAVADWVLAQYQQFDDAMTRWRRLWWTLWFNRNRLTLVGERLGALQGALVMWSTGVLSDNDFEDASLDPMSVAKASARARAQGAS